MFLRGVLAAAVLSLGAVLSVQFILDAPMPLGPDNAGTGGFPSIASETIALAPISLGNPAAAATLKTRHPEQPETPGHVSVPPSAYDHVLRVGRGDTLMPMLVEAGVARNEAHAAIKALAKIHSPRRIRPGQEITLTFKPNGVGEEPHHFLGLTLDLDFAREVVVERSGKGFKARQVEKKLTHELTRASGTITNNLFDAATEAGTPISVLIEVIRAYSWDVDFQRGIQTGDAFEVVYRRYYDEDGEHVHDGEIVFAALTLSGSRNAIYAFTTSDGVSDFFSEKGHSARKALLRTPIDGARLSSRYGRRRHPILGYNKMHRGLDFAAPRGTPIYAAGNGVLDYAGRKGGYGKYIRIRHNNQYSTAYAHMKGYARGMRNGKRVKQGQVIGYVGTTGRSTGPHLHYEILRAGRQVNPMRVKMPSGRRLKGEELKRFQTARVEIERQVAALAAATELASRPGE
jgi:murein DD-endopeptidase MepM/ murein hydrolase activator NlpD